MRVKGELNEKVDCMINGFDVVCVYTKKETHSLQMDEIFTSNPLCDNTQ